MTGTSLWWLIDAVEPCAFGAPLRGYGARPRRSLAAQSSRSIKGLRRFSQAGLSEPFPVGSIPSEARRTAREHH